MRTLHLLALLAAHVMLAGCGREGFECGTALLEDEQVVRACTRTDEVCVCATHACALPSPSTDSKCESGLKYVDVPFAPEDLANTCVAPEHASGKVLSGEKPELCESGESESGTGDTTSTGSETGN